MATVDTHDAFSIAEYERRWSATLQSLEDWRVDLLIVTTPTHIQWLTGHDAEGSYAAPYFLIVAPDQPRRLLVRLYDEETVRQSTVPDLEIVTYYGRYDAVSACAAQLRSLGIGNASVGLELDCWGLAPADVDQLESLLPGPTIVDTSQLIVSLAEIKSTAELAVMRTASRITDQAVETFWAQCFDGSSERETYAAIEKTILDASATTNPFTILFGERTALPHGAASEQILRTGDVAFFEGGAGVNDYMVGVCRTATVGKHAQAQALHSVAEDATAAAMEALKPGALGRDVHAAAQEVVDRAGRSTTMRQRVGYGIGIKWYDRGYTSLDPASEQVVRESMTFHLPRILFDESGRFGIGTSETVLVTARGAERFSSTSGSLRQL